MDAVEAVAVLGIGEADRVGLFQKVASSTSTFLSISACS